MLNKIFLGVMAIAVVVVLFITYYSWSWLQSIGDPRTAWESFNYDRRAGVYFLIVSTIVLLVIANVVLWTVRNAWAMWATHLFFSIFAIVLLFWLHLTGISFCIDNGVCQSPSRGIGPLLAVFGIVVLGVLVFFDQYVVLRLHGKMYRNPDLTVEEKDNSRSEETES